MRLLTLVFVCLVSLSCVAQAEKMKQAKASSQLNQLCKSGAEKIDEEKISLQLPDKKKRYSPSSTYREVAFADIASTMVQISFK